jgi:hypothetical protein
MSDKDAIPDGLDPEDVGSRPCLARIRTPSEPRRRHAWSRWALSSIALVLAAVALVGCTAREPDPRCAARDDLRRAVRSVNLAASAHAVDDAGAVQGHLADAGRFLRSARAMLASLDPAVRAGATGRRLDEAANYLGFIVADATGAPDFSLAQFAARELNRAAPGLSADAPFTC